MTNNTTDTENTTDLAALVRPLGDPTRLRIFQFLRGCCCPVAVDETTGDVRPVSGPTVGEVCCHITGSERVSSTLSEHLRELRLAGLIVMERRGRNVLCAVRPDALTALAALFGASPSDTEGKTSNDCCC